MSKKSKKELAKAEAMMAKALKMQAKAKKMREEAAVMQLQLLRQAEATQQQPGLNSAIQLQQPEPEAAPQQDPAPAAKHFRRRWPVYLAVGTAAILACGIYLASSGQRSRQPVQDPEPMISQSGKQRTAAADPRSRVPESLTMESVWELPKELREISGNVFIDSTRVACVQDNDGVVFIYNLASRQIEARIGFAGNGDYEGLTRVGETYFVLRSDGSLFEVMPAAGSKPAVRTYDLPLSAENETESLFYDAPGNRLLVGVKERDPSGSDYKGVYAFDLKSRDMSLDPVLKIARTAPDGEKQKPVKPSEIAIGPEGTVYVLNGPHAELLIADKSGAVQQTIKLDKDVLPQPEGLSFAPDGSLYISSEGGKKQPGAIAKVRLQ